MTHHQRAYRRDLWWDLCEARLYAGTLTLQGKNAALREAGAIVPESFEGLEGTVAKVYQELVADGTIQPRPEPAPPTVPQDLAAAQKAGLVRSMPKA